MSFCIVCGNTGYITGVRNYISACMSCRTQARIEVYPRNRPNREMRWYGIEMPNVSTRHGEPWRGKARESNSHVFGV